MRLMTWEKVVRRVGGSLYVALPYDFCRAHEIKRYHVATYTLEPDGSLNITFQEPNDKEGHDD